MFCDGLSFVEVFDCGFIEFGRAGIGGNGDAFCKGRARGEAVEPGFEMRLVVEALLLTLPGAGPGPDCDIGDGEGLSGDEGAVLEAAVNASAAYLVTHNVRDFSAVRFAGLEVVTPGRLLALLEGDVR